MGKFADVPAGCFASLEAVPTAGWLQIMVLTCMQEAGTGFASKPQTDDAEPGDIALDSWVRYDDPEVRTFKLNAERQNGRAAMRRPQLSEFSFRPVGHRLKL